MASPSRNVPLFHARLVRERAQSTSITPDMQECVAGWLRALKRGDLDEAKETSLHGEFLVNMFGRVLGYRTMTTAPGAEYDLVPEKTVRGAGSADGALGFFAFGREHVVAPIELKGAAQFLDHARGGRTPVQQGWDYANNAPESRWIIVSNYRETRLYSKSRGQGAFELFLLEELEDETSLRRFRALLGRGALLPATPDGRSLLDDLLIASSVKEEEITKELYAVYRRLRERLYAELRRVHPNFPPGDLLRYTQIILDRVLFLAFAEDRGLVPEHSVREAFAHRDKYNPRPIWQNFLALFRWIDEGNASLRIPACNGGLFRDVPELAELEVSDDLCSGFRDLASYDYRDDVSVDVLGHIFEQSIADLERIRTATTLAELVDELAPPKRPGKKPLTKRRKQGIFYTPTFVTQYIVRETLGRVFEERWDHAGAGRGRARKDRIAAWEAYGSELRTIRVLDLACGSGAFLVAGFDAFAAEYERVNRSIAELRGGQAALGDLDRRVLNENLFGVDLNEESVEISKLSLWLKTASRGKKLTYLDSNIKVGNSVVSDLTVDPLAFDWKAGRTAASLFPPETHDRELASEIDARWREGFDIVISNPPYVRQELLRPYKKHWQATFRAAQGTADLFVYFFERGIDLLRPGGRLGFIVSNKWLRGGYAERLRQLLKEDATIESVIDFGHAPIFEDVDAFPCIVVLRKATPTPTHDIAVTKFPRERLRELSVPEYVETHRFPVRQATLRSDGWILEPPDVLALLEKIRAAGAPLNSYANAVPNRGLMTGFNEAYLIDTATKERLCRACPDGAGLFRRYLRGEDVGRWVPDAGERWIILMKSSADFAWPWAALPEAAAEAKFKESLPALYEHFKRFERELRKRTDRGKNWWELRPCAYYDLFDVPKIVYQEIQFHPAFALDREAFVLNNKAFLLPSAEPWLLAVLNSPLMWWHNWRYLVHMKDEALSPAEKKMSALSIATPSTECGERAAAAVARIVDLSAQARDATAAVLDLLRIEYGVEKPGQLAEFCELGEIGFLAEVKKRRPKSASPFGTQELRALRQLYADEAPKLARVRAEALELEKTLAALVNSAYDLTADEEALVAETAPPRMPPGWAGLATGRTSTD